MQILYGYLVLVNFAGFALMGIDKRRAKRHAWRIQEKTLFLVALLGGSAGSWAGMYVFRHKTRHLRFVAGMPLLFAVQMALFFFLMRGYSLPVAGHA